MNFDNNNINNISFSFKIFLREEEVNNGKKTLSNKPLVVRRVSVEKAAPNWNQFRSLVYDLFGTEIISKNQTSSSSLSTSSFTVEYEDEEKDLVFVSSEQEWFEALRVLKAHNISPYKIYINIPKANTTTVTSAAAAAPYVAHPAVFNRDVEPWPRKKELKCKERKLNKLNNKFNKVSIEQNQEELSTSSSSSSPPKGSPTTQEIKALKKQQKQLLKLKQQMDSSPFEDHPLLKVGALIHLQSHVTKKNLRILQDGSVDGNGKKGLRSTFRVHGGLCNKNAIRLQNIANSNYWLKIAKDGKLDGKGHGGPWTEFKLVVHTKKNQETTSNEQQNGGGAAANNSIITANSMISLRCVVEGGSKAGVGILENGQVKPPCETGTGKYGKFLVLPFVQKITKK